MRCFSWYWLLAAWLSPGRVAEATPLPPDTSGAAPPRLTLGLTSATRTTYLQRAPARPDDRGYLGATLTYQAARGFISSLYLNHSYNFQTLHEPFINYGELMAGWQSVSTGTTYWTVQYTRLFAYGESALVQASLRNDVSASLTRYFDYATVSASADVFVGHTSDFVLTFDFSHSFCLPVLAHDTLTIEPTVEFGAGSQRFYTASLGTTTQVKTRKRGGTTTVFTEPSAPGFSALGYTFSVPVSWQTRCFELAATPSYLVPLHVPAGGNDAAFFYFTVGVTRSFW